MASRNFTSYYETQLSTHRKRLYHIRYNVSRPSWKQFSRRYVGEEHYRKWRFLPQQQHIGVGEQHPVFYHRILVLLFVFGPYIWSHMARQWQLAKILRLSNRDFELFVGWFLEKRNRIDHPIPYLAKMLSRGVAAFEHPEYYIMKFNFLITTAEFISWSHAVLQEYFKLDFEDYILRPAEWRARSVLVSPTEDKIAELVPGYAEKITLQRLRATPQFVKEGRLKFSDTEGLAKLLMNGLAYMSFKHRINFEDVQHTFEMMLGYYDEHVVYYLPDVSEHAKKTYYPPAHSAWRMYKLGKGWIELHQAKIVHPYHPNNLTKPHPYIQQLLDYVSYFEPRLQNKVVFFIHHQLYLAVNESIFAFVDTLAKPPVKLFTIKPNNTTGGNG